jgi:membrane dipeptidase
VLAVLYDFIHFTSITFIVFKIPNFTLSQTTLSTMFIFDAHLDLSMNAIDWNRDITQPIATINAREKGKTDKPDRGNAVVSLPALREGNIGLVVATQIARYVAPDNPLEGWHAPAQAWAQTQAQLAWYRVMEAQGEMKAITDRAALEQHLTVWASDNSDAKKPIGYILSLEGADSLISLEYVETAYQYGLRAIGPAHYGPGRYANGTDATGKMGQAGIDLLKKMMALDIILDLTHLCDDAFWQAMDIFDGAVWASHNNCRALVPHNRQFDDAQLKAIIERGGVIGAAFDAWMIVPDWIRQVSQPKAMDCSLEKVVDHIEHICQLAGNALHVGIGSDLDGGFGSEQCPYDLKTIADLQKLWAILEKRGYTQADIQNIAHGNFLRFLREAW